MATPRPIRIPRTAGARAGGPNRAPAGDRGEFRPNHGGTRRGLRLFLLFLVALAAIYGLFGALALGAPTTGVRDNPATWAFFTGIGVVFALGGWWVTLSRAPRGAWVGLGHLIVEERFGRIRRFSPGTGDRVAVVQRHRPGLLSPLATELVEVSGSGSKRTYLVETDLFAGAERLPGT